MAYNLIGPEETWSTITQDSTREEAEFTATQLRQEVEFIKTPLEQEVYQQGCMLMRSVFLNTMRFRVEAVDGVFKPNVSV